MTPRDTSARPWPGRAARVITVLAISILLGCGLTVGYERVVGRPSPHLTAEGQRLLSLINAIREQASCPPVTANETLMAMAQAQAEDMVARGFLSNVNPDNQDPATRAHRFGYAGTVTESFAAGLATPEEVVNQWTNTENAYAVRVTQRIQTCRMMSIGIGHETGTVTPSLAAHVWVMTLGDR